VDVADGIIFVGVAFAVATNAVRKINKMIMIIDKRQHPIVLPIFLCRPDRDVGIPVALANLRFAFVTPVARFQLNESPGIPFFRLIFFSPTNILTN